MTKRFGERMVTLKVDVPIPVIDQIDKLRTKVRDDAGIILCRTVFLRTALKTLFCSGLSLDLGTCRDEPSMQAMLAKSVGLAPLNNHGKGK